MKRPLVSDIVVGIIILAFAVSTLVPVFARIQRTPAEAKCQANLQRIAEAIDCYLEDNHDRYPTNRPMRGTVLQSVSWAVCLSPLPTSGEEPKRFVYGLNWIEALYPYTDAHAECTGQVARSSWRCPNASNATFPTLGTYYNHQVTYALNSCLVEQPRLIVRRSRNLMMLREIGYLTVSTLRPTNTYSLPTGSSTTRPRYPFLNNRDYANPDTSGVCRLHGEGSYIVFADGHVRHFTLEYYPEDMRITAARCWDGDTQQWYNYYYANPVTPDQARLNKSIAISP